MGKIKLQVDCGNAPKKLFLKDFYTSLTNCDTELFLINISKNIEWSIVGLKNVKGYVDFKNEMENQIYWNSLELELNSIITHGSEAAVSGIIISSDQTIYSFCDIYKFKSAGSFIIDSIRTFIIKQ
jgi:hypothetical protein